jgi:hypothetical protein
MTFNDADFIPVSTDDAQLICDYLRKANYEESNHNLINLFQWMDYYPLWKYVTPTYILLLGVHKGKLFTYMPLCESKYFEAAIQAAKSIFDQHGIPFELSCFTEHEKDRVLALYPTMEAVMEREGSDYLYDVHKLKTLSGKSLQKRRNHYNAFVRDSLPFASTEPISAANLDEVKAFLNDWRADETDEYFRYEKEGTFRILDLHDQLPYQSVVMRLHGQVKAFVIASQCTTRMIQINIEKADPTVRGLYQAVEIALLHQIDPSITLVNRENDMGLESLRQAKKALDPLMMVDKYRIKVPI